MSIGSDQIIMQLTKEAERVVNAHCHASGFPEYGLEVQVAWNQNSEDALGPKSRVRDHFEDGDTMFVHGDLWKKPPKVQISEDQKVPVTILTGFLGAGKTTLLNYILEEQRECKIAVIENEFGAVSIDDQLIDGNRLNLAEDVIVMDNGCMCCTVRGDLEDGLRQILAKRRSGKQIDSIILETTGMADPVPIIRTFMASGDLLDELRLDGVITVADAKHILQHLDDSVEEGKVNESYQQVAFCDKIILNKLDLVSKAAAIEVKQRIRGINFFAKVLPAVKCRVNVSELINMHAHDTQGFADGRIDILQEPDEAAEAGGHGSGHAHVDGHGECSEEHGNGGHGEPHGQNGHGGDGEAHSQEGHHGNAGAAGHGHVHSHGHENRHDSRVNSTSLIREAEFASMDVLGKFIVILGTWPKENGTIFRIKGILAVKEKPEKYVIHAVMDVIDRSDAAPWAEGEKRMCKLVVIGKALDLGALRRAWEKALQPQ